MGPSYSSAQPRPGHYQVPEMDLPRQRSGGVTVCSRRTLPAYCGLQAGQEVAPSKAAVAGTAADASVSGSFAYLRFSEVRFWPERGQIGVSPRTQSDVSHLIEIRAPSLDMA